MMEQFAAPGAVQKRKSSAVHLTRLLIAAGAGALILFVVLCLLTRTGNARSMLIAAMISAVLCGWGILAFWLFTVEPARAEARHLEGLSEAETQVREGRMTLDPEDFRIPRSVRVLKVKLETDKETLSLNLNEKYRDRIPPDGSRVRVMTVRKFITGLEVLESAENPAPRKRPSAWRGIRRGIGRFFPGAVIWAIMAVILTGFVFTRITDTDPAHKITVYADCGVRNAAELAEKLEQGMGGAVRMVKVHPFSFAMFGTEQLKTADLYIVPDSRKADYAEWLGDGMVGIMADPDSGRSAAGAYFLYSAEKVPSVFRLYTGMHSVHLEDGLTEKAAELLLHMEEEKQ